MEGGGGCSTPTCESMMFDRYDGTCSHRTYKYSFFVNMVKPGDNGKFRGARTAPTDIVERATNTTTATTESTGDVS